MSKRTLFYIVIILCCLVISVFLLLYLNRPALEPSVDFPTPPLPMQDPEREPSNLPGLFD
jgi:hypothetical protein